jgi:hypothetical protein
MQFVFFVFFGPSPTLRNFVSWTNIEEKLSTNGNYSLGYGGTSTIGKLPNRLSFIEKFNLKRFLNCCALLRGRV